MTVRAATFVTANKTKKSKIKIFSLTFHHFLTVIVNIVLVVVYVGIFMTEQGQLRTLYVKHRGIAMSSLLSSRQILKSFFHRETEEYSDYGRSV